MIKAKRIWAAVIVFCMLLTLVPMSAFAEGEFSGKCGKELTWTYDTETKTLTISGTGEMYYYTQTVGTGVTGFRVSPWRADEAIKSNLEKVVIEEGATDIGQYAFYDCSALKEVVLPDSVTKIGNYAFSGCTKLEKINIDKVTGLSFGSFYNCTSLDGITLAEGITFIWYDTFFNCSSLTKINIPASLTSIVLLEEPFRGCTSLEEINVAEGNADYSSIDGVLFNKDKTELYKFPAGKSLDGYEIPESVTSISAGAFRECSKNKNAKYENGLLIVGKWIADAKSDDIPRNYEINVADSVTHIANSAFVRCENLKNITVPKNITSIGRGAFWTASLESISVSAENENYSSLDGVLYNKDKTTLLIYPLQKSNTTFVTPETVEYIEGYAFDENEALLNLTLPGVKKLSWCSLSYTNITDITFSSDLEEIDEYAFYGCEALKNVYYAGDENSWSNITIKNNTETNDSLINAEITFISADKPELSVKDSYTYTGEEQTAEVDGYNPVFMKISGNIAVNAGTYEITVEPKTKWKDGTTDEVKTNWTISKAKPTGKPNFRPITEPGKTLADANLITEASSLSVSGTVQWVADDGITPLEETTVVEANKYYKWLFTPTDTDNYETLTGSIKLYSKSTNSGTTRYTVSFVTNGGSKIASRNIAKNAVLQEPTAPKKDGFEFAGWYSDKELNTPYNFSARITKNTVLYAKWTEPDDTANKIILVIGKKEASVFGKTKSNDVAPKIVNNRTMLPARFVAESLGANVEWDGNKQLVTITGKNLKTGEEVTILITIGAENAVVNGEEIKLDSPAFIENDRTYSPIRFISEHLGASVEWAEEEQTVTINAKK